MNTTIVVALLGLLVATTVTTAAGQQCTEQCTGDAGGNIVIFLKNFRITFSVTERFLLFHNTENNLALYLRLNVRLAALIRIDTKYAIIFKTDSGNGSARRLDFDIIIGAEADGQLQYRFALDIHAQITKYENVVEFNFYLALVKIAAGTSTKEAFNVSGEVAGELELSFKAVFDRIKSSRAANALVVLRLTAEVVCAANSVYVEVISSINFRLPAEFGEFYLRQIGAALRGGKEAIADLIGDLRGAVTGLGEVVVGATKEWIIELKGGAAYQVSCARDIKEKRWSLVFIACGNTAGNLEIGFMANFLFVFNKKYDYVAFIYKGRVGVFYMRTGTGFIKLGSYCAIIDTSQAIASAWHAFEQNMSVVYLQAAFEVAIRVVAETPIGYALKYSNMIEALKNNDGSISTRFTSNFGVFIEYTKSGSNTDPLGVCFSEHTGLALFSKSFSVAITVVMNVPAVAFETACNAVASTLLKVANIGAGFKFEFSVGGSFTIG